jgi:DNA polymerase-3 subunit delta
VKGADRFFEQIEDGDLPPVIAVGGPERALVDDAIGIIRRRALEGAIPEFNHDQVVAKEAGADRIVSLAETLPTMARRRLVEVQDADQLSDTARLEAYLQNPAQETVLLFIFASMDMRKGLARLVKKLKHTHARFDHPRERDMPGFVRARARRHGVKLAGEAVEALALTVGTDLVLLDRGLEKLALVADGGEATLQDVSEHVADTHLEDAFRLVRAFADGNRTAALTSLRALEAGREEPLRLLGLVAWQLRRTLRARAILDGGGGKQEIKTALNESWDSRAEALMRAARKFDLRQHERRLMRVVQCDRMLKSSRAGMWRWMERLALELCPEPRRRRRTA